MSKRRFSRLLAVQVLYALEYPGGSSTSELIEHIVTSGPLATLQGDEKQEVKFFAEELVKGVVEFVSELDSKITELSDCWKIERMPLVDRNILRVGSYELLYRSDIPTAVTLNEAVEIARELGSPESPAFVNGVLDALARNHQCSALKDAANY